MERRLCEFLDTENVCSISKEDTDNFSQDYKITSRRLTSPIKFDATNREHVLFQQKPDLMEEPKKNELDQEKG